MGFKEKISAMMPRSSEQKMHDALASESYMEEAEGSAKADATDVAHENEVTQIERIQEKGREFTVQYMAFLDKITAHKHMPEALKHTFLAHKTTIENEDTYWQARFEQPLVELAAQLNELHYGAAAAALEKVSEVAARLEQLFQQAYADARNA